MLLQRKEQNNEIKALYESSNILASNYHKDTKELILTFKKGVRYKYSDVSLTDYTRFELADSQGKVLTSHIQKYKFNIIDPIDPDNIELEVDSVREEEYKELLEIKRNTMIDSLKNLMIMYENGYNVTKDHLIIMERLIKEYREYLK